MANQNNSQKVIMKDFIIRHLRKTSTGIAKTNEVEKYRITKRIRYNNKLWAIIIAIIVILSNNSSNKSNSGITRSPVDRRVTQAGASKS